MIKVRSPGKIMLSGEWSVLEPGNCCIVTVVDRFLEASLKLADKIIFHAPGVGLKNVFGSWQNNHFSLNTEMTEDFWSRFKFCFFATQVTLQFLQEQSKRVIDFEISIKSELTEINQASAKFSKLGLGSSAATVVVICKGILAFHGYDVDSILTQEIIFKLACMAHFIASGKIGSGFDVAASAFQTTLIYSRFDQHFLEDSIKSSQPLSKIVSTNWPGLKKEKLQMSPGLNIVVGFSGFSSSTTELIKKMYEFKFRNPDCYKSILDDINFVVLELISAIKQNREDSILSLIKQNNRLLLKLSLTSGVELQPPEIKKMISTAECCGVAAKISGAGGGDCVIALSFDVNAAYKIRNLWQQSFIVTFPK